MSCFLYAVTHRESGRSYIGISKNPAVRWRQHIKEARTGRWSHFWNALRVYGAEAFAWTLVSEFESAEQAGEAEKFLISTGHGELNIKPGGNLGHRPTNESRKAISLANKGRKWSAESIAKRSATVRGCKRPRESVEKSAAKRKAALIAFRSTPEGAKIYAERVARGNTPEKAAKIGLKHKGKVIPQEMRDRISAKLMGHYQAPHTEETKQKISQLNKGKGKIQPPRSAEHQAKLVAALTGRKRSPGVVAHMRWARSLRKTGRLPHIDGRPFVKWPK